MLQERLNDAAIALHRVLNREGIHFGIFGGYAIMATGGVRESKDIDCLAAVSKEQIIQLLNGKEGFVLIPQFRTDYVAFFWLDKPDSKHSVLVEIFCEQFPGAQFSMTTVTCDTVIIQGLTLGLGMSRFLSPFYLFKGKLSAAASRNEFRDSADLRMLVTKHEAIIKSRASELNLEYVGRAAKRHLELGFLFEKLGIDVKKAMKVAKDIDRQVLTPAHGEVQRGLLA